jgi:metal-dependent amidase/aminoacylase/carboxypeptidase family protein
MAPRVLASRPEGGELTLAKVDAELSGTIRTFDPAMKQTIHGEVERIAKSVAESMPACRSRSTTRR